MKITFVTGSLEAGRDGVGDYTRSLAAECVARGVSCRLLAFADRHVDSTTRSGDPSGLDVLRLPFAMSWRERVRAAREFLQSAPPDWVSVQFVPYSFHRWGLASALTRALPEIADRARLHVMLHEIWIDGHESWRRRLMSGAQRRSITALCRRPGALIHTSNTTYQALLRRQGVEAGLLPLFGSIPVSTAKATDWLASRLAAVGCDALSARRSDWWLAVIFGALPPVWPPEPLLTDLLAAARMVDKRVAIISVGRLGPGEALWTQMTSRHASGLRSLRLGEQPVQRISELLNTADFGIATGQLAVIGKSAAVAAMFEHGLPVIVNREDNHWKVSALADSPDAAGIVRTGAGFASRLQHATRQPPRWRLPEVAAQWLDELSAAPAAVC